MPGGVDMVLGPLSGFLPLPSLPGPLHGAEGSPQPTGAPASTNFSQVSLCFPDKMDFCVPGVITKLFR